MTYSESLKKVVSVYLITTNPLSLKLTERLVRTIVVVLVAISAFSNKK